MNRRRQHRRISPGTARRYQAIKNFVRRALGSSSQQDHKSNSSISESVLDLRQKIDGFEQQLNTVSKHCQGLISLESRIKLNDNLVSEENTDTDTKKSDVIESGIVYTRTSQDRCDKPVRGISTPKVCDEVSKTQVSVLNKMINQNDSYDYKEIRKSQNYHKLDSIKENERALRKKRRNHLPSRTLNTHLPMYNSHSFNEPRMGTRRLDTDFSEEQRHKNHEIMEYINTIDGLSKLKRDQELTCGDHKNHRNKYLRPSLDQDFIADIIRRQYRPVKLFGKRPSDFSQFSAPVCKDQEFPIREMVQEESELCSCCREEHGRHRHSRYMCSNDLSDIRSICDTRLYSSKKHKHHTHHRKRTGFYDDSTMYDVIPVKEKSSPKTSRKFVEDKVLTHGNYREVPPSPRTQRPRFNLKAQLHPEDNDDEIPLEKQLRPVNKLEPRSLIQKAGSISNMSSDVFIYNTNGKAMQNEQVSNISKQYNDECIGTISNLQYPMLAHEKAAIFNDTTLNTQTTDISVVKTDKTLNEIKDILQSFLQEIKKESSQTEKLNNMAQSEVGPNLNETQQQIESNSLNNNNNFGQCSLSPFMQSFPNSCCCYPILPLCPINCMQNGLGLPSPSFTCVACANNAMEGTCTSNDCKHKTNNSEDESGETQKLIKEIHNLISQKPNSIQKKIFHADNIKLASNNKNNEPKTLMSRSVGGSTNPSKHDAKVGTTKLKCHSKSCEAIKSRDTRYATNFSYSDTILEKGSGEETTTESATESEYSSEAMDKQKENKFTKILKSIGIMKRNKTDGIEELNKNDSYMDIAKPKEKSVFHSHPISPFQQHIINYNMHGQEYYHTPVTPQHQHHHECGPPQFDPICYSPNHHDKLPHRTSPCRIPIPPSDNCYDPQYHRAPPQVPVCLKEIEVKSIGTQSGKKMSLLQKLTNKMQGPEQPASPLPPKQITMRTSSKDKNSKNKPETTLFDWKKFHEKAMQKNDPYKFSFNAQNKLDEEDNKMRNALLKKLFYKRNPFSPRNLLVKTLLGKDKSSFGAPPKYYKPRMFM